MPAGQGVADVTDLLAHLVPGIRHGRGRRAVLDREEQGRLTRPRVAAQEIDVGSLLQLAGNPVGHLFLDLSRRRAGPERADHHHLESERRILGLCQLAVRQHPNSVTRTRMKTTSAWWRRVQLERLNRWLASAGVMGGSAWRDAPERADTSPCVDAAADRPDEGGWPVEAGPAAPSGGSV